MKIWFQTAGIGQRDNRAHLLILSLFLFIISAGCAAGQQTAEEIAAPVRPTVAVPTALQEIQPELVWQEGAGQMHGAILDPSGQYLATGTSDGLFLYDAVTGELIQQLGPQEPVFTMAFSPDSQLLAFAPLNSGTIEMWDVASLQHQHTFAGDGAPARQLAFSPTGDQLAVGSFNAIQLWQLADRSMVARISPEGGGRLRNVLFSPDGERIAAAMIEGPGRIELWNSAGGEAAGKFLAPEEVWLANPQFSADGRWLAAEYGRFATPAGLILWSTEQVGEPRLLELESGPVPGAWAFSADGEQLAAGYRDGNIQLWATAGAKEAVLLSSAGESTIAYLEVLANDEGVLAVYDNGDVSHWSLPDGTVQSTANMDVSPRKKKFIGSGVEDTLFILNEDGRLNTWDTRTGELKMMNVEHIDGPVNSLAFSPDGQALAVGTANGQVKLRQTAGGEEMNLLPDHFGAVEGIAFAPDGSGLASAVGERINALAFDDSVRLWSWPDGSLQRELAGEGEEVPGCSAFQNEVAYTPDSELLASASHDFTVQLWSVADGKLQLVLEGNEAPVLDLALSPDGTAIASASEDGTLRIWQVDGGRPVHVLPSPAFGWQSVTFSPDGEKVVGATAVGEIVLWNAQSGELIRSFAGGINPRSDLLFVDDGSLLAIAVGSEVHLWHTESGQLAAVIDDLEGVVESLAISDDGNWLAAGGSQGKVAMWRLPEL